MKKCIHCGKEIENDSDFCFYCGKAQSIKSSKENNTVEPIFTDQSKEDMSVNQKNLNEAVLGKKTNRKKSIIIISIIVAVIILAIVSVGIITYTTSSKEPVQRTDNIDTDTIETMSDKSVDDGRTYFDDFSIILPDDWVFEEQGDTIRFCSKYKYEHGYDGLIFCIEKTTLSEDDYMGAVKMLGVKNGYNYFVVYPMGMGLSPDETANQKHAAALQEQDDVINSFELVSDSDKLVSNSSNELIPSVTEKVTEDSDLYNGLRFIFTRAELDKRQHDAITKLGIENRDQYEWNRTKLEIYSFNYMLFNSSEYTSIGNQGMYYNGVCYLINKNSNKNIYALDIKPMTETDYHKLVDNNPAPVVLSELNDTEYENYIIELLKKTSYINDLDPTFLQYDLCMDMSYGELIALMFESPQLTIEKTGSNSCLVTVSGTYRDTPGGPYVYSGNAYIEIINVETANCSIYGDNNFSMLAKGFALTFGGYY